MSDLDRLLIERELIATADGLDNAVDAKDWPRARSYFADRITFSFAGSKPSEMPADELVGMWQANLYADKKSFHLRGNHLAEIDGDTAVLRSVGYAWNKLPGLEGGALWEVWGDYFYRYERQDGRWKITSFAFTPKHQRGNDQIPGYRPR